ncbi:MAG: hypothetical protein WDO73_22335 [Ignavibacteriota bacterium]
MSFNDGDDWQPLRLNMPATSIRDLVVHDEDVVVGTHGRGFWILDDISPLRELTAATASADAHLFAPRPTYRYPRDTNTDTPLPPEEPAGKNPPDGAILYYYLKSPATGAIALDVLDAASKVVAHFSSEDKAPAPSPQLNVADVLAAAFPAAGGWRGDASFHLGPARFAGGRRQGRTVHRGYLYGYARERRPLVAGGILLSEADG